MALKLSTIVPRAEKPFPGGAFPLQATPPSLLLIRYREQLQHHQRTCTVVTGSQAKQNPSPSRSAPGPAPSTTATDRRPTGGAAVETTSGTHRDDPNRGSVSRSHEQNAAGKRGRYVSNAWCDTSSRVRWFLD
jgi:hypothetical protein